MKINYDIPQIDAILQDFHAISGMTVSFWDIHLNMLSVQPKKQSLFCETIRKTPEGRSRCLCSDHACFRMCMDAHAPATHICHAGLPDSAVPLYHRGELLGFIMFGQVMTNNDKNCSFEQIWEHIKDLPLDKDTQEKYFSLLPVYDKEKLRAAITIASACVQHILSANTVSTTDNALSEEISTYVTQHLGEELDFRILAQRFHLSTSALYKMFHAAYGCTVHGYIQDKRMLAAARLLIETDDPIFVIAQKVGIPDAMYFSRLFKRKYRVSPLAYRKQSRFTENALSTRKTKNSRK